MHDGPGNYRYVTPDQLLAHVNARSNDERFLPSDPVRFLLVNKKQGVKVVGGDAEQIGGTGDDGGRYLLYRVKDPDNLKVLVND